MLELRYYFGEIFMTENPRMVEDIIEYVSNHITHEMNAQLM